MSCFFFQAEDGIRDWSVTGVQTCALPISAQQALAHFLEIDSDLIAAAAERSADLGKGADPDEDREQAAWLKALPAGEKDAYRSEERRVGKEGRSLGETET